MSDYETAISDMVGDLVADGMDPVQARDLAEQQWHENEQSLQRAAAALENPQIDGMWKLVLNNLDSAMKDTKRLYYAGHASYDDMRAAARRLLEMRQKAERVCFGKVTTKVTPRAISDLIR